MSYSFEARKMFQLALDRRAGGDEPLSGPVTLTDLEDKIMLRLDDTAWEETCDTIEEQVEDLLIDYDGYWREALSSMFYNQLIAAAVAIDEQGQRNMTNVNTFQAILEILSYAYCDPELRLGFWTDELSECRPVMIDIVDFLIEKCRTTSKHYYITPSAPVCSVDIQRTLEHAFIIKQFSQDSLATKVARFQTAFAKLYRDCCNVLWAGSYKDDEFVSLTNFGWCDSDSSNDDSECQCRASLARNNIMMVNEKKCRKLQNKTATSKSFRGQTIVPIPRKKGVRQDKIGPSPLGRTIQSIDGVEREGMNFRCRFRRRRYAVIRRTRARFLHGTQSCSFC